jgi:hypothetical protein
MDVFGQILQFTPLFIANLVEILPNMYGSSDIIVSSILSPRKMLLASLSKHSVQISRAWQSNKAVTGVCVNFFTKIEEGCVKWTKN